MPLTESEPTSSPLSPRELAQTAAKAAFESNTQGLRGLLQAGDEHFVYFDCIPHKRRNTLTRRLLDSLYIVGHGPKAGADYPTHGPEKGSCKVLLFEGDAVAKCIVAALLEVAVAEWESKQR